MSASCSIKQSQVFIIAFQLIEMPLWINLLIYIRVCGCVLHFSCIPTRSAFALGAPAIYSSRCSCKIHIPSGLAESQGNKNPNKYLCFIKEGILYLYCPCMLSMETTEGFTAAKHTWISKHLFLHSVIPWQFLEWSKDEVTSCPLSFPFLFFYEDQYS